MKKIILLSILTLSFILNSYGESRLDKIKQSGVLKVGVTGDFNPMNFINPKTKAYEGFDIEMVKALAADMNVEVEFVKTDWKTLINGVLAGKYDITCSASLNPKRALVAGYTNSYIEVKTVPIILKKNSTKFNGWDDLNKSGMKIATTLGTVFEEEAKRYFPNSKKVSVESPARDYQEVLAGRADASITSNVEAFSLIKKYNNLSVVGIKEGKNRKPLAMLVDRADQEWINFLNHWIQFKEAQGYFSELRLKWIGEK